MNKKLFWILFIGILIISALIRFVPPQNNNFYFTTDQAYDAVHVREILESHKILLKGPETGISGVYHGPLWYYFLAIGYFIFGGHPFGGLFVVIILNLITTAFLMWYFSQRISPLVGVGVGTSLFLYWPYYDFSRYAFNPFPAAYLSIFFLIFLAEFLEHKKRFYYFSLIPIFFAANSEIIAAAVFLLVYFLVGLYGVRKRLLSIKEFLFVNILLPAGALIPILYALYRQFSQSSLLSQNIQSARGYFSGLNVGNILFHFGEIFQRSILPQSLILSCLALSFVVYFAWKNKTSLFVQRFCILTSILWLVSFLFFSSNKGWMEWHTYDLYLTTFISFFLLIISLPRRVCLFCFGLFMTFQAIIFVQRYKQFYYPSDDPGLLVNQIKVIDWIYQNSEHDGFSVFTYSPTGFDYPYQYLYWWYGKQKFDFIPCEYSNAAPGVWKLYMPEPLGFNTQGLGCSQFRFLVFEPGGLSAQQQKWVIQASDRTVLLEEKTIGQVKIEKRRLKRQEEL